MATSEPARVPKRRRRIAPASRHLVLLGFTALALPPRPVLSTLTEALAGGDLYRWLFNSFFVTAASVLVSTALAALAAYPLSLMRWRPGSLILGILIALLVVPPIVLIVPIFQMVVDVG